MSQLNPIDQLEHDIWILKGKLLTLKQQLPYTMEGMEKERLAKLELELQDMQEEIKRMKETLSKKRWLPKNLRQRRSHSIWKRRSARGLWELLPLF